MSVDGEGDDLEAPLLPDHDSGRELGAADATEFLQQVSEEKFDIENAQHEEKLRQLWHLAFGEDEEQGRDVPSLPSDVRWKRLGFQSHTPHTDFRGGGVFSLDNVIFMMQREPVAVKKILNDTSRQNGYPFVPVCINVCVLVLHHLSLTHSHPPVEQVIATPRRKNMMMSLIARENVREAFGQLFMHVMFKLHHIWLEESTKPDVTLLQFGHCLDLTAICVRTLVNRSNTMTSTDDFYYVMDIDPASWLTWFSNGWDSLVDRVASWCS